MPTASKYLLLALAVPSLAGCPSPNLYSSPRTTPEGKLSHTIAVEGYGGTYTRTDARGNERTESSLTPTLPTYQLRYGAADDVDVGFRVANLTSLGLDAKYNPLRSKAFDLAVAPGAQWFHLSVNERSAEVFYLHAPVLVGFNLSEAVTIVASPGVMFSAITGDLVTSRSEGLIGSKGIFARLGLGVNVRFSSSFGLQPEVTAMRAFTESAPLIYAFGLGFNFGRLPVYGADAAQAGSEATKRPRTRSSGSQSAGDEWLHPTGAPTHGEEVPR